MVRDVDLYQNILLHAAQPVWDSQIICKKNPTALQMMLLEEWNSFVSRLSSFLFSHSTHRGKIRCWCLLRIYLLRGFPRRSAQLLPWKETTMSQHLWREGRNHQEQRMPKKPGSFSVLGGNSWAKWGAVTILHWHQARNQTQLALGAVSISKIQIIRYPSKLFIF